MNILVIHADQHRWDCLGCAGNKDIKTPNIDDLAKNGVIYEDSFCAFPICTPSRYSLLSGLYVRQHMGYGNKSTLAEGIPTFPKELRKAGYETKAVGKMHLNFWAGKYDKVHRSAEYIPGWMNPETHDEEKGIDRSELYMGTLDAFMKPKKQDLLDSPLSRSMRNTINDRAPMP